ncbi:hypothetical protein LOD99_3460 [Oopsacas minuta]|uniref:BZIP domain-containing protein n=1 Tax=Oopsacas minuta TaxID=111878 RepID=A0AAV7JXM1_9METZ|nr:hypothetical protein LOD99_3460 [Oopsacas minuta]
MAAKVALPILNIELKSESDIFSVLNQNDERIVTEATSEKCHFARDILIEDFSDHLGEPFLKLVSVRKLVNMKATHLGRVIDKKCFSMREKEFIREARRKFINRLSAKKSRILMNNELDGLEIEVNNLLEFRQSLIAEKHQLLSEIHLYAESFLNQ